MSWLSNMFKSSRKGIAEQLAVIIKNQIKIMATQAETAAAIKLLTQRLAEAKAAVVEIKSSQDDLGTKIDKIGTETDGLKDTIQKLTDAINSGGATSPEIEAALIDANNACQAVTDAIADAKTSLTDNQAKAQVVDDKVTDAPPTP